MGALNIDTWFIDCQDFLRGQTCDPPIVVVPRSRVSGTARLEQSVTQAVDRCFQEIMKRRELHPEWVESEDERDSARFLDIWTIPTLSNRVRDCPFPWLSDQFLRRLNRRSTRNSYDEPAYDHESINLSCRHRGNIRLLFSVLSHYHETRSMNDGPGLSDVSCRH